jgi:prophage regulatory protein
MKKLKSELQAIRRRINAEIDHMDRLIENYEQKIKPEAIKAPTIIELPSSNVGKNLPMYLNWKEIIQITGASRTSIWRWCNAGLFPKPTQLGPQRVGWLRSEIEEWANNKNAT